VSAQVAVTSSRRPWPLGRLLGSGRVEARELAARALVVVAAWTASLSLVANFVVAPLRGRFTGDLEDLGPILYAGHQAAQGGDIYGQFVPGAQTTLVTYLGFDYPPLVAWLGRPLAALPYQVAQAAWLWMLLAATVASLVLIAREVLPPTWPRVQIGVALAGISAPATYDLWHGQINPLILLSLALALRFWMRGQQVRCGVALGIGAALKVAPLILLVLLLRRRWWRGAAAGGATAAGSVLAGALLVGPQRAVEWFTQVLPVLSRDDGWFFNQGWNAVVNRLVDHSVYRVDAPAPAVHLAVLALAAGGVLAAAWTVRPAAADPLRRATEFAAGVTAMLLAGTIAWYSAYIHLVLPLLVVLGLAAHGQRLGRGLTAAALAVTVMLAVIAPAFLGMGGKDWLTNTHGTLLWWPALQLVSLPALCAACLLAALIAQARRGVIRCPVAVD